MAYSSSALATKALKDRLNRNIASTYATLSEYQTYKNSESGNIEALKIFTDGELKISAKAAAHNSFFRGKDITSKFTSGKLYEVIVDGSFEDIYVGDYFTASINGTNVVCRIAGFDIYLHKGDTEFTRHHAVIVPDTSLMNAVMNSSNTTANGYKGSAMNTTTMATVKGYLQSTFGDHLLSHRELISSGMDSSLKNAKQRGWSGASSASLRETIYVTLMNEVEVYGTPVFGSSKFDIEDCNTQLPLFRLRPDLIHTRFLWWLRSVVSSAGFAVVNGLGYAYFNTAGNSFGVRPRWLIG